MSTSKDNCPTAYSVQVDQYFWTTSTHRTRACGCREEWATMLFDDVCVNVPAAMLVKNVHCPLAGTSHRNKWFPLPAKLDQPNRSERVTVFARQVLADNGCSSLLALIRPAFSRPTFSNTVGRVYIANAGQHSQVWSRHAYDTAHLARMVPQTFIGNMKMAKEFVDGLLLSMSIASL